jgi:tetratricopeptide (TPR) repeat protein
MPPEGAGHHHLNPGSDAQRPNRLPPLFLLLLTALLAGHPFSSAADAPPRVIRVKFAVDEGLKFGGLNKGHLKDLIRRVNGALDPVLGLRFELGANEYWEPGSSSGPLPVFLNDLRRHVPRGDCEVVVGLLAFMRVGRKGSGLADYNRGYAVVSLLASPNDTASVLLHELGHVFGAPDLVVKGSAMNPVAPGTRFDPLTRDLILLHRSRGFGPGDPPCPRDKTGAVLTLLEQHASSLSSPFRFHYLRGCLSFAGGDHDRALGACREALRLEPRSAEVLNLIGAILYDKGEAGPAIQAYQQALEEEPGAPETRYNLGLAFIRQGLTELAIVEIEKAVSLDPRYAEAWANLGWLYLGRGEVERSIAACRRALETDYGLVEGTCTLAAALILQYERGPRGPADSAEIDEAIALCQKAAALRPDLSLVYNLMGMAFFSKGDARQAEAALLKSLELDPGYLEARFNLSCLYFESGATDKAAQHLLKVIERAPDSVLGTNILSRILGNNRDFLFLTLCRGERSRTK